MTEAESGAQMLDFADEKQPIRLGTLIGYGIGQTGAQVFRDTPAVLLPVFLTTMLGVPAWLSGFVVLFAKLWLIFCDPLMGSLSDRVNSRHGRTPFLISGALLTGLGFISLFSFSEFSSPYWAAATIGILFLIASTAFSAFSVPYLAIAAELSKDTHERTKILSYRMAFAVLGVILSVGLAQPLVAYLGNGFDAWQTMAILLGGLALATMMTTGISLRGRVRLQQATASPSARRWGPGLKAAGRNRPFVLITGTHFIQQIGQACGYTVVGFIFIYVIQRIELLLPFILVMAVGSLSGQPLWMYLSRRIGKKTAFLVASACWLAITITWLWVKPGDDVLLSLPLLGSLATQELFVLVRGFIIGLTNTGFILLITSMLTDSINTADRNENDHADEGLLSGIFSALEKLAFALGPVIAGIVLSGFGFQSSVNGAAAQSSTAITGIIMIYSVIPAIIVTMSLFVFWRYPLESR